jgi:hypothetical protein
MHITHTTVQELTDVADGDAASRHVKAGQLPCCRQLLQVRQLPGYVWDALGLNLCCSTAQHNTAQHVALNKPTISRPQ